MCWRPGTCLEGQQRLSHQRVTACVHSTLTPLVHLLWLLALAPTLAEQHVAGHAAESALRGLAAQAHQAHLRGHTQQQQ